MTGSNNEAGDTENKEGKTPLLSGTISHSEIATSGGALIVGDLQIGGSFVGRDLININQVLINIPSKSLPTVNQLRSITPNFIGREEEIEVVARYVDSFANVENGKAPVISIVGMGGIGKTELANVIAHKFSKSYPDSQFYVDLATHGSVSRTPVQAASSILFSLLKDNETLPAHESDLFAMYRSKLSGRHSIIILDDISSDVDVMKILPPPGCLTIVTSRSNLTVGKVIRLTMLSRDCSVKLLRSFSPKLEDSEAEQIATLCCDLPLAVNIAGGFLKTYQTVHPTQYLERLNANRLGLLGANIIHVFKTSYDMLTPELQADWVALSVIPHHFSRSMGLAVVSGSKNILPTSLDMFVSLHLLEYNSEHIIPFWSRMTIERFRWHDLLREFANSKHNSKTHKSSLRRYIRASLKNLIRRYEIKFETPRWQIPVYYAFRGLEAEHHENALLWYKSHRFAVDDFLEEFAQFTMAKKKGAESIAADSLGRLGLELGAKGKHLLAKKCFQSALTIHEARNEVGKSCLDLLYLGDAYRCLEVYNKALNAYCRSALLAKQVDDTLIEFWASEGISHVLESSCDLLGALEYANRAMALLADKKLKSEYIKINREKEYHINLKRKLQNRIEQLKHSFTVSSDRG